MRIKSHLIAFGLAALISAPAAAQVSGPTTTNTAEDEVIAYGTTQVDPAMSAWNAGDYATAEIEFERNAFCALRVERNFRSGVEGARDSTLRSLAESDAFGQPIGNGGPSGAPPPPPPDLPTVDVNVNSTDFDRNADASRRTCDNRGFQIYMTGMSQLKLGKREEAMRTFEKATNINRQLYDAHFRLSLLEYQDGDREAAKKEFAALKRIAKKCRKCDAKDEIEGQVRYLSSLLN